MNSRNNDEIAILTLFDQQFCGWQKYATIKYSIHMHVTLQTEKDGLDPTPSPFRFAHALNIFHLQYDLENISHSRREEGGG